MSKAAAVIPATVKHTASLIFLHGLGDVGSSWQDAFNMYRIAKAAPHVKFIFPNAPVQRVTLNMGMPMPTWFDIHGLDHNAKEDQEGIENPVQRVTLNMGMPMPTWFDIHGLDHNAKEDQEGIEKSSKLLKDLIEEEIKSGIPAERVIVGGFSMGGAVAIHAALTSPHTLGGVLALSTWLPLSTTFPKALISGDKKMNLPILQCHGDEDPMVQLRWARLTEEAVKALGFKQYTFKEYRNMGHSSCDQEMDDVSAFVVKNLPKTD
ncbi:unnamed protein product [Adineta steineri]|uniref:palmitoyl-protein hydrolase n=1 Tax=Adineta steineri TaxID=433720 RepID=A0A814UDR1_9BILA|nr:unnamed protein product [Adineta steineri]